MQDKKEVVVLGLLGVTLDLGRKADRWHDWRPTVAICSQPDLIVSRFELLCSSRELSLAHLVAADIAVVSPETEVRLHEIEFEDPWDFEIVYETLFAFARGYTFDPDREDYLIHITTGTHVAQICLYLLTESRFLPRATPANLTQPRPPRAWDREDH